MVEKLVGNLPHSRFYRRISKKRHFLPEGGIDPEAFLCEQPKHDGVSFTRADKYLKSARGLSHYLLCHKTSNNSELPGIVEISRLDFLRARIALRLVVVGGRFGHLHYETKDRLEGNNVRDLAKADVLAKAARKKRVVRPYVDKGKVPEVEAQFPILNCE